MNSSFRLKHELNTLQRDATKVISTIGAMTKEIVRDGQDATERPLRQSLQRVGRDLEQARERANEIRKRAAYRSRKVVAHARSNPLIYAAGLLGVGAILATAAHRRAAPNS